MDILQDRPRNGISVKQMSVNCIVLGCKRLLQRNLPPLVEQTEPSRYESVVPQKSPFLRAALDNHIDQLAHSSKVALDMMVRYIVVADGPNPSR